ncbi:MAG: glycosyltransferase [Candidatus Poribacteria bacterium]|nr:glycosyltransferase [Candidatus Poribacteria bacterium]MDE0505607.1 glycosyltransferase [Candidatus Poribacteria bacterium]
MIDYLTHPKFLNYDPSIPPSSQGGGGGMGTKTYRVLEALRDVYPRTQGICDASEITADTVLIEPLRFTLPTEGYGDRDLESVNELIHGLRNHKSRKILYCSELTLMRMPHVLREQVVESCDLVTANCKYQANLFKYVNVHTNHTLCDPVPDVFLSRLNFRERKRRLVATGNVSWQKNAPQVVEVFKRLKGAVERVYVGSAALWYTASEEEGPQRLQEELYANTDRVVHEATTEQIAREFQDARFGFWCAFHDTFATAAQEMMMSGMPVVAAKHGLASEMPAWSASGVRAQVDAVKRLAGETDESLEQQSERISKWARENVSYAAFQGQLKEVLRAVW